MKDFYSAADILAAARKRIADPRCWTQHTFARDVDGFQTPPLAECATRWCAAGALRAEAPIFHGTAREAHELLRAACVEVVGGPASCAVPRFNDDPRRKHSEVLAMYDRAIEMAREVDR